MKINLSSQTLLYFILIFVGLAGFGFTFFLPAPQGFYAAIVAAAAAGFGVAYNVWRTKRENQQLVCPTGSDCNAVVTSRYAQFFGIPLEYLGMFYYAVIVLTYLGLIITPAAFTPGMIVGVVALSVLAGLFSLYLLFVQAVLLRKWCIWCILSALLSLAICILSLVSTDLMVELARQYDHLLQVIRSLGLTLGVGGVTAAAILFGQSLDDNTIDEGELSAIQGVFELVWIGLGLVIVGQCGLYVAYPALLASSGVFIAQMSALAIAVVSGAALMLVYAPFLTYVPFSAEMDAHDRSFKNLRKPVLSIGATVIVAWYFVFFTSYVATAGAVTLLIILLAVLFIAVAAALIWDRRLSKAGK